METVAHTRVAPTIPVIRALYELVQDEWASKAPEDFWHNLKQKSSEELLLLWEGLEKDYEARHPYRDEPVIDHELAQCFMCIAFVESCRGEPRCERPHRGYVSKFLCLRCYDAQQAESPYRLEHANALFGG